MPLLLLISSAALSSDPYGDGYYDGSSGFTERPERRHDRKYQDGHDDGVFQREQDALEQERRQRDRERRVEEYDRKRRGSDPWGQEW